MTRNLIRTELIEWLSALDSDEILAHLKSIKDSYYFQEPISQELNESLERAEDDIKNDRLTDHEDVIKKYDL